MLANVAGNNSLLNLQASVLILITFFKCVIIAVAGSKLPKIMSNGNSEIRCG